MRDARAPRSPLHLAALASTAVRGLDPVSARPLEGHDREVDAAGVVDSLDRSWVVRAPRSAAAAARLGAESRLVEGVYGWVSFAVPRTAGTSPLPEGGHAYVHRVVAGTPATARRLDASTALAATVGRSLAVIHDLPIRLAEEADLPVYGAEEYRQRRLAEVDRAAATGRVPSALLSRWENAIEESTAWRFVPCVVHGDLDENTVRVEGNEVSGITDWSRAHVADPAEDFAWLAGAASSTTFDAVVAAYAAKRRSEPDPDLTRRAHLYGELALARWLLHGVGTDDEAIVTDAVAMLHALDDTLQGRTAW